MPPRSRGTRGTDPGAGRPERFGPYAEPHGPQAGPFGPPARTGLLWLLGAAAAFTLAVLALNPLHQGFSWDETVYVSQISKHTPAMPWAPERARGMPLLVAPVTLITGSPTALRVYLPVLAGAALFLALLAWRRLRPAWVLALAGLVFGCLWVAQLEASLVFPNFWAAVGALAAAGLFLRGVTNIGSTRANALLLGVAVAFTALMRPADAVFVFVPLLLLGLTVTAWRSWPVLLAVTAGLAVGLGEWLAEAYLYFGGLEARLRETSGAVGGTGFHPLNGLRIMNGGTSWTYPDTLGWWAVFILLAMLGVWAVSRSRGWPYALVPAVCAASVYLQYSFPNVVIARYLLPTYLLLAVPVADGIAWLSASTLRSRRIAGISVAAVFIAAELASQHLVFAKQIGGREAEFRSSGQVVSELHHLGIHPPCIITSDINDHPHTPFAMPAAFYVGCAYAWNIGKLTFPVRRQVVVIEGSGGHPFGYARSWPKVSLPTIDGAVRIWFEPRDTDRA